MVLFQDIEVRLPQHHQSLALTADGEQAPAIGRPGNGGGVGKSLRPQLGIIHFLIIVQVKDVHLAGSGYVAGAGTPGYEGDAVAVGGPGGSHVVPVAIGDLRGVAGAHVDEEQVKMIVAAPADGVVAVADAPHRLFFWLALRWPVLGRVGVAGMVRVNVGNHHKPGRIGRPGEFASAGGEIGQAGGLPAVGRNQPDLAPGFRRVIGAEEGKVRAVG